MLVSIGLLVAALFCSCSPRQPVSLRVAEPPVHIVTKAHANGPWRCWQTDSLGRAIGPKVVVRNGRLPAHVFAKASRFLQCGR